MPIEVVLFLAGSILGSVFFHAFVKRYLRACVISAVVITVVEFGLLCLMNEICPPEASTGSSMLGVAGILMGCYNLAISAVVGVLFWACRKSGTKFRW